MSPDAAVKPNEHLHPDKRVMMMMMMMMTMIMMVMMIIMMMMTLGKLMNILIFSISASLAN